MHTSDTALIKETIEEVNQYRDLAMWNRLEDHFVDTLYVDDQALTKDEPGKKTIGYLISGWKKELKSYFYATRHNAQTIRVKPAGKKNAVATALTTAKYFISDSGNRYVLTVVGTYTYELVKKAGRWKIGKIQFDMRNQHLKQIGLPV